MTNTNFDRALAEITKEYGARALVPAAAIRSPARIPTGLFGLDARLGGGIPLGRVIELVGEFSAGKSSLALSIAAQAQRLDRRTYAPLGEDGQPMRAVWLDLAGTFDAGWAAALGVDVSTLYVAPATYLEQAYDMVMALIRTGEVDLLVIDDIASMAPSDETEDSMEKQHMGLAARGNNKGLRKITAEFNRLVQTHEHAPAVLMINQMREKLGVLFGNPETSPGGRGREFFASLRIKLWPEALGKSIKDDDDEIVGRVSTYRIEKNKVNGTYGQGQFTIYLHDFGPFRRGMLDDSANLLESAVRFGLVEQKGAFYAFAGEQRVQGKAKAVAFILEHPDVRQALLRGVMGRFMAGQEPAA